MIIGVCGTFAAGKDMVADYLASARGFNHVSSGDVLRKYIVDHHLGEIDRDSMREIANKTRAEKGADFFVHEALASASRPLVVSGIRTTGELEALKNAGGIMIGVDAPISRRYNWAKERGRIGDQITQQKFREQEVAEESDRPTDCQITAVMSLVDFNIANDGTLDELYAKVDDVLKRLMQEGSQA
jgi:dephospho-CoA kinase